MERRDQRLIDEAMRMGCEFAVDVNRVCAEPGCLNFITSFAYAKGEDPRTVPVWCGEHAEEAKQRERDHRNGS